MQWLKRLALMGLYWIFRAALSLRYRVEIEGLSEIIQKKKGGLLFLPNHPAEMDPVMLTVFLWPNFQPRPLVVEHFFYVKGLNFFMQIVKALPLPTMDFANTWKVRQVEKLKKKILESLEQGENFLIYPSGKLKLTPDERIGGASLVPDLIRERPIDQLVLIRTTGLWGSIFSRALTSKAPEFGYCMMKGAKVLLKNGIFFAPRRKVKIEFSLAESNFPKKGSKIEINRYLERWYNKQGPEPLSLVSYSFWKEEFPTVPKREVEEVEVKVPRDVQVAISEHLAKITPFAASQIDAKAHLSNDLGLDSIDTAQLYVYLEEQFGATGLIPGQLQTVGDLLKAAVGQKKERELEPISAKMHWPDEVKRKKPQIPEGETLAEVFLQKCDEMGGQIACADNLSGTLTYKRLKKGALVLAERLRKIPDKEIGILLPSSVGAYTVTLAVILAGKVPVLLNWTAGSRSLEHAVTVANVKVVLTSFRFLSRLDDGDFGFVDDQLVFLEEIRKKLTLFEKLKGVYLSLFSASTLLKKLSLRKSGEEKAVILFTSGTESLPKGVPLSHKNILTDLRAALKVVRLEGDDILYGVLPPFHSFGLSVTGLFPLISGLKVAYGPDPTDAKGMARDIERYRVTIVCCAPSFVQALLKVATRQQLSSVRLMVTGAEKAPEQMVAKIEAEGKLFLEGYGISECSPIVTFCNEGEKRIGVGRPLPGLLLTVIDSDTNQPLPEGDEGEICIRGETVFAGYIGSDRNPFVEIEGNRWYRSGDRGRIDEKGNLILTGRLSRFVKIGGEMVSLGGIEEDIRHLAEEKGWIGNGPANGPSIAVSTEEGEGKKAVIILYTTEAIDLTELNRCLRDKGSSRLVKVAEVRRVAEIPLTGTGKILYRLLDQRG